MARTGLAPLSRVEWGETERAVDPYGVLYRNGGWYMGGYCHLRQGLRAFRLDRAVWANPCHSTCSLGLT